MDEQLKEDFPVDWEDDHYVSRREFFKFLTLASGGLAVGTGAVALASRIPRTGIRFEAAEVCPVDDVKPGASLAFSYPRPSDLCILVRRQDGSFVAFTRRCTHLSCPVVWEPEANRLYCPCHNGAFSIEDGAVLQGPPPRPLPRVKLEVRDRRVWALGVVEEAGT